MTTIHHRFPWIVSAGLALLFLGLSLAGTPIGNWIEKAARLPTNSGVLIQQLLLALLSALAVTVFGGWRKAGFQHRFRPGSLLYALPMLAAPVILLFISGVYVVDPLQIALLVIFTAMIGFTEEAMFRGVVLNAFLPRGPVQAAVISSLLFGVLHLINLFYGMDIVTALLYVFYATLLGIGFAAPFIRGGGAIWPLIFVHGLYDFLGKMGHGWGANALPTTSTEIVIRLAVAILVGIYGFWLLKQKRPLAQPAQPVLSGDKA